MTKTIDFERFRAERAQEPVEFKIGTLSYDSAQQSWIPQGEVIDLSHIAHTDKVAYIRELLPMVAELRRTSGQPHWIVVDEAHYFLPDPDFESGWTSSLPLTCW